jgi:hypothetical protein
MASAIRHRQRVPFYARIFDAGTLGPTTGPDIEYGLARIIDGVRPGPLRRIEAPVQLTRTLRARRAGARLATRPGGDTRSPAAGDARPRSPRRVAGFVRGGPAPASSIRR